jgi:hypothetical protein
MNQLSTESPRPLGTWQSLTSATRLVVQDDGQAVMYANGMVQVAGAWSWNAGWNGGTLDVVYPMPLEPGHVRYAITWIDGDSITVFGEPFQRETVTLAMMAGGRL